MFEPNYQLTGKIVANLAQIERLYGYLEGLNIPKNLELNLERNNLIESSYISNSIEGNPLSYPEVSNLILDEKIPITRSEKEIVNYFEILKNLSDFKNKEIALELAKRVHQKLMLGVNDQIAGQIRNVRIVVGKMVQQEGKNVLRVKHHPPSHDQKEIETELKDLFSWLSKNYILPAPILAGIFHHQYVYIHPFEDGNGRTCRLLTTLIFLKLGYKINKYFVLDDFYDVDRALYSDKLHSADFGDKTQWLEYFTEGVYYSLQSASQKYLEIVKDYKIEKDLTPKEKEVLEIFNSDPELKTQDVVLRLNISRQQAHFLLSNLVKKGFLSKSGSTKSSKYLLK